MVSSGFSSSNNNDGNCGRTHGGKWQWKICTLQTQQQTLPSCGPVGTPLLLQCSPLGCSDGSPKEKGNVWLVPLTLIETSSTFCVEIVTSKQELKWNLSCWFVQGNFWFTRSRLIELACIEHNLHIYIYHFLLNYNTVLVSSLIPIL